MIGRLAATCFIPGMFVGVVYLSIILWQVTGFTPIDLINAVTDTIVEPLQQVAEALK